MNDPRAIRMAFFTKVIVEEARAGVFQYRIENVGESPLENMWIWFAARGNNEEQKKFIPTLAPRQLFLSTFNWVPTIAGEVPLTIVLGVPGVAGPDDRLTAFTRDVIARVSPTSRDPQSVSIVYNYQGGTYQVGDTKFAVDLVPKTGAPSGPSFNEAVARLPESWAVLELYWDGAESHARQQALITEEHLARLEELLQDAEMTFEAAKASQASGRKRPADRQKAEEFFKQAHEKGEEALRFAREVVKIHRHVRRCREFITKVADELPEEKGKPPVEPAAPTEGLASEEPGGILRRTDGHAMDVWIIPKSEVLWGRHSEMDVFVALEPFELPPGNPPWQPPLSPAQENYVRSTDLSRKPHFITRMNGGIVRIADRSKNGTWRESHGRLQRLDEGVAVPLGHGDRLHLAGNARDGSDPVLSLEVAFPGLGHRSGQAIEAPTNYARGQVPAPGAVVFRRLNNCPEREYLLLSREATIGRNPDSAIVLHGEGVDDLHAVLTLVEECLAIRRMGGGALKLNGMDLRMDEVRRLPDRAELQFGSVPMTFRRLHPLSAEAP